MNGFQWFLKSIGIDLSPDGIKEMFSKVTPDDIRHLVTEVGLNPDELLALPKIVAVKLQEFEQRQIRILQLLESMNNERHTPNGTRSAFDTSTSGTDTRAITHVTNGSGQTDSGGTGSGARDGGAVPNGIE